MKKSQKTESLGINMKENFACFGMKSQVMKILKVRMSFMMVKMIMVKLKFMMKIFLKQAGAELCQAQPSLS